MSRVGVVVLDALRYDVATSEMPALHDLADHVFANCYSTARWTSPAHASLFTGYYPTEVGTGAGNRALATPEPTLAEQFHGEGYRTVAASNNINVDRFFDFDRGFETFRRGPGVRGRPGSRSVEFDWSDLETRIADSGVRRPVEAVYHILRSDAPTLPTLREGFEMFTGGGEDSHGIEWIEDTFEELAREAPADLFFFANLMPCHYPYAPPEPYSPCEPLYTNPLELTLRDSPVTEREHERYWRNYLGAARYLDDTLPDLIDRVDWDLLFVVGDHGELFDDHGLYGHQYGVYEELVHVPALAVGDEVPAGRTEAVTSLLDVSRTVLEVAGLTPAADRRGVNLFEGSGQRTAYAESVGCEWYSPDSTGIESEVPPSWAEPHYAVREADAMYIHDKDGDRAFDPETGRPKPDREAPLGRRAGEIREGRVDRSGDAGTDPVPGELQDRLEALGYR